MIRILIVEDEVAVARAMAKLLNQNGYHTVHAHSATEALRQLMLDPGEFNCVLLDINLGEGELSGLEVARVKRVMSDRIRRIPVIIISGLDKEEILAKANAHPLDGVGLIISKPWDATTLLRALEALTGHVEPDSTPETD